MDCKRCCGTCKYHYYDSMSSDWDCNNPESEFAFDYTPYGYCCDDWEERNELDTH